MSDDDLPDMDRLLEKTMGWMYVAQKMLVAAAVGVTALILVSRCGGFL